jgi:DNA-binding transcriptional LysR family regulator
VKAAQIGAQDAAKSTRSLRIPAKAGFKHPSLVQWMRDFQMAYNIVAERDNETVRMRRDSSIIAIAKARVWASEGWEVTIIDDDENPLVPAEDQRLLNG